MQEARRELMEGRLDDEPLQKLLMMIIEQSGCIDEENIIELVEEALAANGGSIENAIEEMESGRLVLERNSPHRRTGATAAR
jgi:hypothetical protein